MGRVVVSQQSGQGGAKFQPGPKAAAAAQRRTRLKRGGEGFVGRLQPPRRIAAKQAKQRRGERESERGPKRRAPKSEVRPDDGGMQNARCQFSGAQ